MEFGGLVSDASLASAKSAEVLCSLGNYIGVELKGNAALSFASDLNVEENGGVLHGKR